MKVNRITTVAELCRYTPELVKIHETLEGRWEPDLSTDEFLSKLIELFNPRTYYFGLLSDEGELLYFVTLLPEEPPKATFWLFYMNKNYRTETQTLLRELAQIMVMEGFHTIYSQSTRTEKSYERWLSKFGARKIATVYKFNLI
jgi:hypothetical protein